MTDTPDQGRAADLFDADVARDAAHTIRWDEQRAMDVLEGVVDIFDLLDAAIETVAHRGDPGRLDVLAVRIVDIIPEALP